MRLLVSGATTTVAGHASSPYLGHLIVPKAGNRMRSILATGLPWAADNAAFTRFDAAAFCAMLGRIAGKPGCRFVACPDVVGDARATLDRFEVWQPVLAALSLPVALVAQDGLQDLPVPWDRIDAVFLGGSTTWKLGSDARAIAAEAKARGLWVHMGRCNSRARLQYAHRIGCDSVDGSGFSRWPERHLSKALLWLADIHDAPLPRPPGAGPDSLRPTSRRRWLPLVQGLAGWVLGKVSESPREVVLHLRHARGPCRCPHCGGEPPKANLHRHGTRLHRVKDLPFEGKTVRWLVRQQRYLCRACGRTFAQELPDLSHSGRGTRRLADSLAATRGANQSWRWHSSRRSSSPKS